MAMKYLRPRDAAQRLGIGLTSFWGLAKSDPTFPELIKLGTRTTVVEEHELEQWLESKRRNPRAAVAPSSEAVPA